MSGHTGATIVVKWTDFLEMFYRMSLFIDQENKIMLKGEDD